MLRNAKVKETVGMSLSKLYRPIAKTQVSRQDNDTFIGVSEIS
jgi:predicted DNA-binding transcriptional regulator AlpA